MSGNKLIMMVNLAACALQVSIGTPLGYGLAVVHAGVFLAFGMREMRDHDRR